ncbi:MAG: CoA transferase [Dehalococcoidia bacterium]|nr:CoA transferase [Dehalococcoidia bacterium]
MSEAPLSGLSVIDLTHYIGGPLCTKLLAGMGAEVIKVEQPGHGDPARRMGPFPDDLPDHEKSGTFLYLNTGKKSITLNLKSATGIKILKDLVKEADVLVENFEPRVMQSLGLSYSILERINPRLVITSISNFGQTGPYRDYKAEEMAILALGGMMYLIGDPEREPLRWGFEAAQYMGGLSAFTGTMAALHYVEQTGAGQQVDISLLEGIVASHFQAPEQYAYTGVVARRNRTMLVFPCKDGVVQLALQPHHWPKLTQLVGMPELLEDPRFRDTQSRTRNYEALETLLLPWMIERSMTEIYHAGQSIGFPVGYGATTADLFEAPQYHARGFLVDIEHPRAGKLTYPGTPVSMGDIPWQHSRAPLLGEHNEEIYCGRLGLSRGDMVRLREGGVI